MDYRSQFKACGVNVEIHPDVYIEHPEVMEVGDHVTFMKGFYMMGKPGVCRIGSHVTFYPDCFFQGSNGTFIVEDHVDFLKGVYISLGRFTQCFIRIGHHTHFAPYGILYGQGGLTIGAYCNVAAHVVFATTGHDEKCLDQPMAFSRRMGPITLEDDIWIAANATITAEVRIARGCVIAANAVVTRDTEPMSIYMGVPARRLCSRGDRGSYNERLFQDFENYLFTHFPQSTFPVPRRRTSVYLERKPTMAKKTGCDLLLIFPPIRVWDNPRNFPTGLGLIAAEVRQAGYRVRVVDANGLRLSDEQVMAEIEELNPAVIGIGGLITTYGWVKQISHTIRKERPDTPIIVGGSVGTSIPETMLKNTAVDIIVMGEGDLTTLELLPALLNGGPLENIQGLAFLRDGKLRQTPPRPLIEDISTLPYPAWDLFPMDVYLENPVVGVGKDIDIISSRGCSFGCKYCYKIFGRNYRGRSAEHVVGEMEALKKLYDVDFISFQDDCFVIDKKRVYKICDLIDASEVLKGIRWSCNGRVTVCDRPLVERMRASGCISVAYGIESGSETILRNMNKHATLEQAAEAIEISRAVGVKTPLAFMIGYPGETRETVMETVQFCKNLNIPLTSMTFTCPYPGTPLYEELRAAGKLPGNEEDLVLHMGDAVDLTLNLTEMPDEELIALRQGALELARMNYTPPRKEAAEVQERTLYGDELYEKAQKQLLDPRMRAHRQRHGFNEGQRGRKNGLLLESAPIAKPVWATGEMRPYVIAEAGVNHNGKLPLAMELVKAAKEAGANCVKFQAFSAEELVTRTASKAQYQENCGDEGETQWDMLRRYEMSPNSFEHLKKYCDELVIDFLVTPFSTRWVKVLVEMGVNSIKVGSGNVASGSLLDVIGQTGLPVIVSTGMSTMEEIDQTLARLRDAGVGDLAIMQCVSLYPTRLDQANLNVIATLKRHTGLPVGFSDHTTETITGALAVAAGAAILEKHFTLDKHFDGPDHQASLEPQELQEYIRLAKVAAAACGSVKKEPLPEELPVKELVRFSVVTTQFIKAGSVITREMLTAKRPGTGISAEQLELVVGARARYDIQPDYPITTDQIALPQESRA